jgi:hypothetical protein
MDFLDAVKLTGLSLMILPWWRITLSVAVPTAMAWIFAELGVVDQPWLTYPLICIGVAAGIAWHRRAVPHRRRPPQVERTPLKSRQRWLAAGLCWSVTLALVSIGFDFGGRALYFLLSIALISWVFGALMFWKGVDRPIVLRRTGRRRDAL